jgi:membrane protein DedA with SNARE-associated domain
MLLAPAPSVVGRAGVVPTTAAGVGNRARCPPGTTRKALHGRDDTGSWLGDHPQMTIQTAGYPALFLLVMAESGGIPLPGETALITAAIVASQGKLQIEVIIALAALAAIIGDNLGYLISRKVGRRLLERPGLFERRRRQVLEIGEPFFERHGPKAVFFGRWIVGLRTWASWLAGATGMPWRSFAVWNAAGGISWATTIGLVAYFVGATATNALTAFGLFGLLVVVLAGAGALLLRRLHPR